MNVSAIWPSWRRPAHHQPLAWKGWHQRGSRTPRDTDGPVVIFSDPDGSLLDHRGHPCGNTCEALSLLAEHNIPLVLCSSRTRAEIELIQEAFQFRYPFISESGSAAYIPRGYFATTPDAAKTAGYDVVAFASPNHHVVEILRRTAKALAIDVRSFTSMTVQEVADECGLSLTEACLAQLREYGEPFRILASDPSVQSRLLNALRRAGLRTVDCGRFHHLSAGADIRRTVRALTALYRQLSGDILTVGISAGAGDPSLLCEVDIPIVIPHPDVDTNRALRKVPTAHVTSATGSLGWDEAILSVVEPTLERVRRRG